MPIAEIPRTALHPLEPLSAAEIETVVTLLRAEKTLGHDHRFATIYLNEPAKDQVRAWEHGEAVDRQAWVVVLDNHARETYEAVVSLTSRRVVSWHHVPDVQPGVMLDEFEEAERAVKADPAFREALARRGITDLDQVCVEPWSAGFYGDEDGGDRRLLRTLSYTRMGPNDNPYAHPIDNLVAVLDVNRMQVIRIEDYGASPVPAQKGNYTPDAVGPVRSDLKPLEIVQPEGPSFEVDGWSVSWERWRLRLGFTPREGLVLHDVRIQDGDRLRPVLYRASLSEMVVPYGDPGSVQYRKNAFDAGEYNIGALANSLKLGCDCLGEIRYFDAVLSDSRGTPLTIENAICMHEEDAGLLWKHYDFRTTEAEVRRSRRLVISFIATVANYEYAFYWHLYQDGTIEFEVKLTGIPSTATLPEGEGSRHGQLLNRDGLYAPIHQHLFNVRLDMDVDGPGNSVYEVHTEVPEPGPENPYGNAFYALDTLLPSERAARMTADPSISRHWKIVNHAEQNAVGEPVAYKLVPGATVPRYMRDDSHVARRAGFTANHLWVTPYEATERYAAGEYPNQSTGYTGLDRWTDQDRPIVDEDVVVWHTFGTHHVVRLEDWPVMPVQHVGFKLEPFGFFDQNPALDVAPSSSSHCHPQSDGCH